MNRSWREEALVFECNDNRLVGVVALPAEPATAGVIILVGGPQYRVGSHRQFTRLARDMAEAGIPSLRFDFTGMGDSEGERREFTEIEPDIEAGVNALLQVVPTLRGIVLWGLCDAASAAMMFAHRHAIVRGLVLLNPWVHEAGYSPQVKLSHYYRPYLSSALNWRRLFSGKVDLLPAFREFFLSSIASVAGWIGLGGTRGRSRHPFVGQMLEGLQQFEHDGLVILSGDDLTAREYAELVESDRNWQRILASDQITTITIDEADHTFSKRGWKDIVSRATIEWLGNVR